MRIPLQRLAVMASVSSASVALVILSGGGAAIGAPARQSEVDWNAVQDAVGRPGTMINGGVFRIGIPRTDLKVTLNQIPVQAGFALGSYAAFKQYDDGAMVMGDLVLLDEEVNLVMQGLLDQGFEVSALHNHVNNISPHIMYMHYAGHGDALQLAQALHTALSASATPLSPAGPPPPAAPPTGPLLDVGSLDGILGYQQQLPAAFQTIQDVPLPGDTSRFDYASIDPTLHRLFIAHLGAGTVPVFDIASGTILGQVQHVPGVHGVIALPELGRVYATATDANQVAVIDPQSLTVIATIPGGEYPDGLAYDAEIGKLYVSDESGGTALAPGFGDRGG